ncbi:hypothetical protein JTB14_024878 [Gonioctena quinquepunctata]|nr:hypothetical protein JTB14_024878 [Gonioctena quinquepunctata]
MWPVVGCNHQKEKVVCLETSKKYTPLSECDLYNVPSLRQESTDDDKTVENPTSNIFDAATSSSKLSFEELLLNTVKHTNNSLSVTKRKKVAAGAEVVTSKEVLDRLTVENRVKETKAKETQQRKEKRNAKGERKRRKNALQLEESFNSSISEGMVEYVDSEDDLNPEIWEEEELVVEEEKQVVEGEEELGKSQIAVGSWVAVEYITSQKHVKHFIGKIYCKIDNEWKIRFLRYNKSSNNFFWPDIEDTDMIVEGDIVKMLPEPMRDRRDHLTFRSNFAGLNL